MGAAPFRLGLSVSFCFGLSVALTSCGSSPQVCNCTSPPQQTFLIAAGETNSQSSQLLSFSIDATTGALGAPLSIAGPASPLTGAPLTALTTAGQGSPFVYVSPQSPNFPEQVYGYSINASTGALTEIASSPFAAEASIALNSGFALNNFLYLGAAAQFPDGLAAAIEAFSIGADGSLAPSVTGSPFPIIPPANGLPVYGPQLGSTAPYLYAPASNDLASALGGVAAFNINEQTGVLTEVGGSPFSTGSYGTPGPIVLDPYGFLYATLTSTPNGQAYIAGFAINTSTGALTPVAGSPFVVNSLLYSGLALDLSGNYLFTSTPPEAIQEFQVNTSTGTLTQMASTTAPVFNLIQVVGDYLDVPNTTNLGSSGSPSAIAVFRIDGSTGALTPVPGSPFAVGVPIVALTAVTLPATQ
jgi:6-phosphogluconolactonase